MNQTGASFNSHNSRLNSPKKLQKSQYYTYSDAYQENINNSEQNQEKRAPFKKKKPNNKPRFINKDMPTTGDASESGLIKFYQPISDIAKMREQYPVTKDF